MKKPKIEDINLFSSILVLISFLTYTFNLFNLGFNILTDFIIVSISLKVVVSYYEYFILKVGGIGTYKGLFNVAILVFSLALPFIANIRETKVIEGKEYYVYRTLAGIQMHKIPTEKFKNHNKLGD